MKDKINPKLIHKFAQLRAGGMSSGAAFFSTFGMPDNTDLDETSAVIQKFIDRYDVDEALTQALKDIDLLEIKSKAKWLDETINLRNDCVRRGNLNAAGGVNRQIGQAIGALVSGQVVINPIDRLEDSAIIKRLAGGDAMMTITLQRLIGPSGFSQTQDVVEGHVSHEEIAATD